ncbi:MAG TPA: rod shape-determining protein MreC, partial [Armatimonadota bacterium]|nr:rod shape-determining protein MreC [Armatimonadota bacterium]
MAQDWVGQEAAARSARRVSDAVTSVVSARRLSLQNDRLAAQTDLLRRQNALLRQSDIAPVPLLGLEIQATRLRELTSTATRALVIGRGPDQWADALILNVGSGSGVRAGDVVVSGPDLVGVIARVYWGTCVVRLVTDRYARLPARCARSQESLGMATGTSRGLLQLRDLPLSSDLREGDLVCTAGL